MHRLLLGSLGRRRSLSPAEQATGVGVGVAVWASGQPGPGGASRSTLIMAKRQAVLSLAHIKCSPFGFLRGGGPQGWMSWKQNLS